jgi:hypothetical protein
LWSFSFCIPHRIEKYRVFGKKRNAYRVLIGKPEGKRPLRRSSPRCKGNIKMCLTEIGCEVVHCFNAAQDRDKWWAVVYAVMN